MSTRVISAVDPLTLQGIGTTGRNTSPTHASRSSTKTLEWRVYFDEASDFDADMIGDLEARDSLDVLLIFVRCFIYSFSSNSQVPRPVYSPMLW